ncbi:TPM domain-containing protein [Macrococcus armenti]|uniref:TPM domain-containing protein n=1 Tax=Macrococcus armenti TaxID=2875764 RepID=UPI001CC9325E|nr:TPM domain-containing protein [Macrococcus armenti]UBH21694.1 TPM domain-containing protein [Macrococcus armenti]
MKRFAILFVSVLIFFIALPVSAAEPLPKLEQPRFVQDHIGIFSESEKQSLNQKGETLHSGTTAEILLMTMPSIGQEVKSDYALRAGREYGVGNKEKNNGIVILLNLDNNNEHNNRGIEVMVGPGLQGVLNDAKVGRLIDTYAMPDIQKAMQSDPNAGNRTSKQYYAQAMSKLYDAIFTEISKSYGFDGEKYTRDTPIETEDDSYENISVFEIIIALFFLILIFSMFSNGGRGGGGGGGRASGPIVFFPTGGGFSSGGFSDGGFSGGSFGGGGFDGGGAGRSF